MKMIQHDEKNVEGLIFRNSKPLKRKLSREMKRKKRKLFIYSLQRKSITNMFLWQADAKTNSNFKIIHERLHIMYF